MPTSLYAQSPSADGLWVQVARVQGYPGTKLGPQTYTSFALDESGLELLLSNTRNEFTGGPALAMNVPRPDGTFTRVAVELSPIFSPKLAVRYPEIQTYRAWGIDDPTVTGRLDLTPAGFHAMLISAEGTFFVDPGTDAETGNYISYWTRDVVGSPFVCAQHSGRRPFKSQYFPSVTAFPVTNPSGDDLRTYRLAVSATGEYTTFFGGIANANAQIATTVNRMTGIYERETAISFTLVATNVYPDPTTDPFTGDNVSVMRGENQADLDANVGDANYDVGHIFSQGGGGGVATLAVVCASGSKARGATSLGNPSGDVFDVDFVSHEVGHQLNGTHTWNGTEGSCSAGQFEPASAYEPGSGSTIMAYAGICGSQNVQPNSDDYFHTRSFDEITAFRDGVGACGTLTATGNTPPTVDAGPDCTIPTSTPFTLTAAGEDGDGDALTFNWEQFDLGTRDGAPSPTFTTGPLFRSRPATTSPSRTFPQLSDILSGAPTPWEVLPGVDRLLNFRVTVRDNRANGGGVDYDSMTVMVAGDPFEITAPSSGASLECGAPEDLLWNVGGGSVATDVEVLFSSDGGANFFSLVASTPNDGSESVTTPTELTAQGRFKLEPSSECFFDISEQFSVVDTTDPSITAPADLPDVECTSFAGASPDLGTPSVNDLCDGAPDVTNDAPSDFPLGTTTVTWTATDESGNSDSDTQQVTVVDTTDPSITAPPDVVAECTSPAGTPVDIGVATASDICDPSVDITNDAPPLFPLGATTVQWTATDDSGNSDSALQTVTIEDTEPPVLAVSVSPAVLWPPNHKMVTILATVTMTDICDATPTVRLVSITSSEPDNGTGDGNTNGDIQGADFGTDDRKFLLRAERSGRGNGRIYTITYEVEDGSGNTSTAQATVEVPKSLGFFSL